MDKLKVTRNNVEDLWFSHLPDGVLSEVEFERMIQSLAERFNRVLGDADKCQGGKEILLEAVLGDILEVRRNSPLYFQLELDVINRMFTYLFANRGDDIAVSERFQRLILLVTEMLTHQRRRLEDRGLVKASVSWEPVWACMSAVYADSLHAGHLTSLNGPARTELIDALIKLLKQLIFFTKPEGMVSFLLADVLSRVDFVQITAIDSIDLAFTLLSYFPGDELVKHLGDLSSPLLIFFERAARESPTWFHPRLELSFLMLLAKLDPKHWESDAIIAVWIDSGRLSRLLSFGMDWIGIPSSASSASQETTASVETTNLHRNAGTLPIADRRRVSGKFARVIVALMWTSPDSKPHTIGWSFLNSFTLRTQATLLPSVSLSTSRQGESGRWPQRLADMYADLVHHWLRRYMKEEYLGRTKGVESNGFTNPGSGDRFATLLLHGIVNVVQNMFGGGSGLGLSTKYVSMYMNLIRLSNIPGDSADTVFVISTATFEDVHKSSVHGLLLASGLVPTAGVLGSLRLPSDTAGSSLSFLLQYALECIDTSNLMKTVSGLGFLDILLIQAPHGLCLRDLSPGTASGANSSVLLNLSTTFPDWASALLERLLAAAATLPKQKTAISLSAFSSEGLETLARSLIKKLWKWTVSNVDKSVLSRFSAIMREYLADHWSRLSAGKIGMTGLVGNILSELMKARFDSELVRWILSRINMSEVDARGNILWIRLLGHALRYSGANAVAFLPNIRGIVANVLGNRKRSLSLQKQAIKLVQRVLECVCKFYVLESGSFDQQTLDNTQYLLDRVEKGATDESRYWWVHKGCVGWHLPRFECVAETLRFARDTLSSCSTAGEGNNPLITLRLLIACGKATMSSWVMSPDASVKLEFIVFRDHLLQVLLANSATCTETPSVKFSTLWIKAAEFVLPHWAHTEDSGGYSMVLRELSGFKIENLLEFGTIGKEFEVLDETRAEYIETKLEGMFDTLTRLRVSECPLGEEALSVVRSVTRMILTNGFEKVKVTGLVFVRNILHVSSSSEVNRISVLTALVDELLAVLRTSEVPTKEIADGLEFLVVISELWEFVLLNEARTIELFSILQGFVCTPQIQTDVRDSLLSLIRGLIALRPKGVMNTTGESSQFIEGVFGTLCMDQNVLHWKCQTTLLAMAYVIWRGFGGPNPTYLSDKLQFLLKTGDSTPLPTSMSDMVVLWLTILLTADPASTRSALSFDSAVRVAKLFMSTKRFDRESSRRQDPVETMVARLDREDLQVNLFSHGRIPQANNKALIDSHIFFWRLLMIEDDRFSQKFSAIRSWMAEEVLRKPESDDAQCALWELYAAILDHIEVGGLETFYTELIDGVRRGDGALVPTIAAAVRMGLCGMGQRSIVPTDVLSEFSLAEKLFRFFSEKLSELGSVVSESSSLLSSRIGVLIHTVVLSDLTVLKHLNGTGSKLDGFGEYLLRSLLDEHNTEQQKDLIASALARLVLVQGDESAVASGLMNLINETVQSFTTTDSLTGGFYGQTPSVPVSVMTALIKTVGRLAKFRRAFPQWAIPVIKIGLVLVANPKSETKDEASKFLSLTARFIPVEIIVEHACSIRVSLAPMSKESLIELICNSGMNSLQQHATDGSIDQSHLNVVRSVFNALFMSGACTPMTVDDSATLSLLNSAKRGLSDLLVMGDQDGLCVKETTLWCQQTPIAKIVLLSSWVGLASVWYEVPSWGVSAVTELVRCIGAKMLPNLRKLAESALTDFFKTQTDRGTKAVTEKRFDAIILSEIRSGNSRHSYIS